MSFWTRFCVLTALLWCTAPAGAADDPSCLSFSYTLNDTSVFFHPDAGDIDFSTTVSVVENEDCPGGASFPTDVRAFQCAFAYDDTYITAIGVDAIGSLEDLNEGVGPEFVGVNTEPVGGPGITIGVLLALAGDSYHQFEAEEELLRVHFSTVSDETQSLTEATSVDLQFDDTLGQPVIDNSVAVGFESCPVDTTDGVVTLDPAGEVCFVRGAVNSDGFSDMADAVFLIRYLLLGGSEPKCMKSADFTDSGGVDIADPIRILQWLFSDGPGPKEPFPACGVDPTPDALTCETPTNGC